MSDGRKDFAKRLARVSKRHKAMAKGYTATLRGDGLIVVEPRRMQVVLPLRSILLVLTGFFIAKSVMLAGLGEASYHAKADALADGTIFGKIGALMLGVDPLTAALARALTPLVG